MSPTTPTPSDPKDTPKEPIRLAPIATVLVVIIIIAFGVCASTLSLQGPTAILTKVAVGTEIACVIGLIVLVVVQVRRS
jgi:hypothetical protein